MSYGKCKKCGCTDENACYSDIHGTCWWVDETHELCSFCLESFADDHTIERPFDFESISSIQP
jgi:hypothetical protein